jgi:hypothetical protein
MENTIPLLLNHCCIHSLLLWERVYWAVAWKWLWYICLRLLHSNSSTLYTTLDSDDGQSLLHPVILQEIYFFLAVIIQIGHAKTHWKITSPIVKSSLHRLTLEWWNRTDFFVYWNICTFVTIWIIQTSLTVTVTDWNIRTLFDMLSDACIQLCKPYEHLAVDRCALQRESYFQAIQSRKHKFCNI